MKRHLTLLALALFPAIAFCEPAKQSDKPAAPTVAKSTKVRLKTTQGEIVIQLNAEKAPISVENFLGYVKKKFYDGTVFHRVMPDFMIQGGGSILSDGNLVPKSPGAPIKNEGQNGLKNQRGTIAMARTSVLDSATSQFFINVKDNDSLDYPNNGGYAVFGKVVEGMEVVDKIKNMETQTQPGSPEKSYPLKPVVITSATVVE